MAAPDGLGPMLELDSSHVYRLDGRVIAGVTDTIKALGPDYDAFFTEEARERGTLVHALTAVMDGKTDEWPDMPEGKEDELSGYCDAWHKFKTESSMRMLPSFTEHRTHNELYGYAGTIDRIATFPSGTFVLIDIKTGSFDHTHILQLAAYRDSINRAEQLQVHHAMAVYLRSNGAYTTRSFSGLQLNGAFTVFLALRSIAEWKKQHGPAPQPDVIDDWVPLADDAVFKL